MDFQFRGGDRTATGAYQYRKQYVILDTENYIHETIMYLISILQNEEKPLDLSKITVELCKRGNTKPLKKVASGDSVEERVLAFAWQHPAIFSVKDRCISLRSMSDDLDDTLESTLESRLIEFLVFRCNQYGPCQIPISKLMGNLQQAASDIKFHFHNDYMRFYNFLRSRDDIFTLIDAETIALKSVFDLAISQGRRLLACDEYYTDERVLKCTSIVTSYEQSIHIVDEILNTKEVVAIDCEGVNLGAPNGFITLVQLAVVGDLPSDSSDEDIASSIKIYLFDVQHDERLAALALRKLLAAKHVKKIFQGCSSDATALYNHYKIVIHSVFDTVIAHRQLHEGAKSDLYYLYEFYVGEATNRMKKDIKKKYISNPQLWTTRPLNELLTYYAAFDVYALIRIYFKLKAQLDQVTYDDIYTRSSASAFSAIRRFLPMQASIMYARGFDDEAVAAAIGLQLPTEESYQQVQPSNSNQRGSDYYRQRPPHKQFWSDQRSRDDTSQSQGERVGVHYNNFKYNGNAQFRNSYRPNYQQNYTRQDFNRPQRFTTPRNQPKHDNTQRHYSKYHQPQYQPRQQLQASYHQHYHTQQPIYSPQNYSRPRQRGGRLPYYYTQVRRDSDL